MGDGGAFGGIAAGGGAIGFADGMDDETGSKSNGFTAEGCIIGMGGAGRVGCSGCKMADTSPMGESGALFCGSANTSDIGGATNEVCIR